jgi:hypothetical protein
MNKLMRFPNYLGRVLLPTRPGTTVLPWRVQAALDRAGLAGGRDVGKPPTNTELSSQREPSESIRYEQYSRRFGHCLALGIVLYLLFRANRWLGLEPMLHSDWPFLHPFWLPLVFTLLYLVACFGRLIWQATNPEKFTNAFPDIDQAWTAGLRHLAQSGINIRELPLFLVLGRPRAAEDLAPAAAKPDCEVPENSPGLKAPLGISATNNGIFVSCAGISVLGQHLSLMIEETHQARSLDQLTEEERQVNDLLAAQEQPQNAAAKLERVAFLNNKAQLQETLARLRYLCQLIVRERRPYCPINGIVVLLPLTALDNDEETNDASTACELDLTVVRETLHVQCPIFAVLGGAEKTPGFGELLSRMPVSQRERWLGQRFPLVADVEASAVPETIQDGVNWFTDNFLPTLVCSLFRLESLKSGQPRGASPGDAVTGNRRLFQLLSDMRFRRQRLTRLLTRGLLLDTPNTFFFGGFYLAGAEPDTEHDCSFLDGVFQRLLENQNQVAWTPDALAEEAEFRRWTWYGYGLLLFLVAGLGLLIYRLWRGH